MPSPNAATVTRLLSATNGDKRQLELDCSDGPAQNTRSKRFRRTTKAPTGFKPGVTITDGSEVGSSSTPDKDEEEETRQLPLENARKPEPIASPLVWAYKRQSLCSTLPYFNAYQSGMYHKDGTPYAILLDQDSSKRDLMLEQVIITTVGGGRERDANGSRVRLADQKESRALHCIHNAHRLSLPVIAIAGIEIRTSKVKIPYPYCVLDVFHVTDVWPENVLASNGAIIQQWVYRLEKVDLVSPAWWTPRGETPAAFLPGQFVTTTTECNACGTPSKRIFQQGWTCLNHLCPRYFEFRSPLDVDSLIYTPEFLAERTPYGGSPIPSVRPPLPVPPDGQDTFGTESQYFKGIVCRHCGCCSSRKNWAHWTCEREGCGFKWDGQILPIPIDFIHRENESFHTKTFVDPIVASAIRCGNVGGFTTDIHLLPNEHGMPIGSVTIMRASRRSNSRPGGPDEIFACLQKEDLQLERNPVVRVGGKRQVLTKHFAKDWGAKYKFGVSVASTGFDEAPDAILRATQRLRWAGENAIRETIRIVRENEHGNPDVLPTEFIQFKELLSIGYFGGGIINYHDDGEKELGPTVATLSLGSPSVMSFRPKKRNAIKAVASKGGRQGESKAPVVRFILNHGDMVVMHGTDIHRLYEHEVAPKGKRRYALTCRYIRPELIADPEDRHAAIIKGRMPERALNFLYEGEEGEIGAKDRASSPLSVQRKQPGTPNKSNDTTRGQTEKVAARIGPRNVSPVQETTVIPRADLPTQTRWPAPQALLYPSHSVGNVLPGIVPQMGMGIHPPMPYGHTPFSPHHPPGPVGWNNLNATGAHYNGAKLGSAAMFFLNNPGAAHNLPPELAESLVPILIQVLNQLTSRGQQYGR